MTQSQISYAQLLETNNLLQQNTDESYWLCFYRTVQESKLFPVPSYMLLSYINGFYRYPALLRKIEARMSAEELGDRARNMGAKITAPSLSWGLPCFYLLGREWLINMGMIRPQDAAEDVVYVMDFWKRFMLAWHRNDGHLTAAQYGRRSQIFPERQLQVFHADMFDCSEGDPLHEAAHAFMAATSQYGFLISCESRISLHNSGPYNLGNGREMLVRDFMDLAEHDFPWLDDVAKDVPYNNLTVPMAVEGTHIHLIDEWGSFDSTPEFRSHHLKGVGLYTSDPLSDGFIPIGMSSAEELTNAFNSLTDKIKDATAKLWKRFAGYTRDQMIDAGAITYYSITKDLAHIAGCYEMEDWMLIDARAERFRPLLNDEYGRDCLGALCTVTAPSQRTNPYEMMRYSNDAQRMYTPIPYSILTDGDYVPSVGPVYPGDSFIPRKNDRYCTTQGVLTQDQFNEKARGFTPKALEDPYRLLCETWVKYNHSTPLADDLYRIAQRSSRQLEGKGAGVTRDDIDRLRG